MSYILSERSRGNLMRVDIRLSNIVKSAIQITTVDFGVIQGRRTLKEQRILVEKGASRTMKSKHLGGFAVDLMAYINGRGSWELNLYDDIADAIKKSAIEEDVAVRWGAAWHIPDICEWEGSMEDAMSSYIDLRRSEGKRPFIDAPHFELA
tara:strand:- start:327 stop:779 length:453 start_codon:yes stop_codon:yes gene_type:complete